MLATAGKKHTVFQLASSSSLSTLTAATPAQHPDKGLLALCDIQESGKMDGGLQLLIIHYLLMNLMVVWLVLPIDISTLEKDSNCPMNSKKPTDIQFAEA